jgi:ribosomal-protein-alanine N-acetyltransferase
MSGELRVRQGGIADFVEIVRMEKAVFSDPWSQEAIFSELQADAMRLPLVAEMDGSLCGYLMAWRVADQLHILNIATDPSCLRRGVGTSLLLAAVKYAVDGGQTEVTLEVRRSNAGARAFYRRHHFAEIGVRPGYYQDNKEDAIIMSTFCKDLVVD